jgi:short-subunit dehydrogenase
MIDAKQLAAKAVKAMLNKRFLLIPGLMTKISVLVVMLIPPFIIHKIKLYLWKRLGRN